MVLKNHLRIITILLLVSIRLQAQQNTTLPNIVFILADDLGYADLGCYGANIQKTPNLDKMASEGVRFTDFYAPAGVCTPTRASLLTGCYPKRVGLHVAVLPPDTHKGLNPQEITLAEILKTRGYSTACIGKWHLGILPQVLPFSHGFDYYYGMPGSNHGKSDLYRDTICIKKNKDILYDSITADYTREAVAFIRKNKNKPFFLYLAHSAVHTPLYASRSFLKHTGNNSLYYNMVEELDWSCGEVLKELKETGVLENTIVVLTSDNGPANVAAPPLHGGKGSTWEAGFRVPLIVQWPKQIAAGSICHEMATMMDFLPTFAKLSGAKITKDREIDGYDIFPLMTNKSSSTPYPFLCYYGRDGQLAAIRQGEWKLHLLEPSEKWAGKQPVKEALLDTKPDTPLPWLYNLNEDVGETKNIAGTNQITVNKLTSLAKAFDLELTKKLRPAYDESVLRNSSLQLLPELNYPEQKYIPKTWKSFWIKCPDAPEADYAVTLYRRTFELKVKPEKFIIHVSADNRYKLFVNGKLASIGPQLSEPKHWRYETIDIAPYLQTGKNNLAAEVANWGPDRFFGIMSVRTGFFVQGNTDAEAIVNTGDKWIAFHNKAISPIYLNWVYGVDIVGGFYASNPGDSIQVAHYPEMWNTLPYDDSSWASAKTIWRTASDNESGHFWLMKARTTPQVIQHGANFAAVVRSSGIQVPEAFLSGKQNLTIPAYTRCSFLLDFKTVTLGFPELTFSGGKGAKITIRYAENLLTPDLKKGDRNVVEGKAIRGIHDVIMPDGRNNFVFAPLWYRGFRYVQLDIETTNEPLNIKRFQHVVTQSPMQVRAKFECDDAEYMRIDEICRRTAEICTQDNLMSDAYYEQMMYVADSKIHALVNLFLSGDPVWLKNAIEQFGYSQTPAGVITSCYPVKGPMHHSNFTLYWIDMMHDYMMYCPEDKDFLRQYVNGIRAAFDMFESGMLENGLVGNTIGKFFIDWYNEPAFPGQRASPGSVDGNSATLSMQYATTLIYAAELFDYLNFKSDAKLFRERAEKVKKAVYRNCWDDQRKIFAENPDKKFFDERANVQAIAAEMFDRKTQKELFERCLADSSISKAGYFFRYKYFEQMRKLAMGAQLDQVVEIWKDILKLNLTTTPERQARQRSDAHPWSASPSLAFLNLVAGIAPAEPNYKSVKIEPAFGKLKYIKASYPHYLGDIKVDLKKTPENTIEGTVTLPKGLAGTFEFEGKTILLKAGEQTVKM